LRKETSSECLRAGLAELQKLLSSLPHPLNKQFHAFVEALLARLEEIG